LTFLLYYASIQEGGSLLLKPNPEEERIYEKIGYFFVVCGSLWRSFLLRKLLLRVAGSLQVIGNWWVCFRVDITRE